MQTFSAQSWPSTAQTNNLASFEAIWKLNIGWVEEPNRRRGGWSGVSRHPILTADETEEHIFIKRQENHNTRTWQHPITGISTFRREYENLLNLKSIGVPVLEILYFAERTSDGKRQSILISRELAGYTSLEDCFYHWKKFGFPEKNVRNEIGMRLATIAQSMHRHRMKHNCFVPKHIFIGKMNDQMDIRLIDLENAKRCWTKKQATLRDLDTLNRRVLLASATDRLRFLLHYFDKNRIDADTKQVWRQLNASRLKRLRTRHK